MDDDLFSHLGKDGQPAAPRRAERRTDPLVRAARRSSQPPKDASDAYSAAHIEVLELSLIHI